MDWISNFLNQLLAGNATSLNFGQALFALLIAYAGGVLSSLTPCVYPMIPITVSVVGGMPQKNAAGRRSWHELLLRAFAYIMGMTLIYSILGVVAGLTGKIFGSFTNTAGWYLTLGVIMTLSALVMLDIIPFDPAVWMDQFKRKFSKKSHHSFTPKEMTLLGAFALGASSGFIAAPCTTPVLTSILAFIAKTQSVGLGLALMIAFSMGLGTLLLVIAVFTGALQILPRSGKWMKTIKQLSGLLLLAFADYLIYRAGTVGVH